jgi:uncharacterized protein (TIGR03085 family)
MGVAQDERKLLCQLFEQVGPDQPTLCGQWLTRDLAAHLVVRERRSDAAGGIVFKPLAGYLQRVQDRYAAKPFAELIDLIRTGPPLLSPYALPGVDEMVNVAEFFVHHEDVRRAQSGWTPRDPDPVRDAGVWHATKRTAKMMFRRSPVGVTLRAGDREVVAKRGPNTVSILGEPGDLLLYAFGRDQVKVSFDGEQSSIGVVQGLSRGL